LMADYRLNKQVNNSFLYHFLTFVDLFCSTKIVDVSMAIYRLFFTFV
jgi:hypothetical protein